MPISQSAKKAWRQSQKKRARNLVCKTGAKKLEKEIRFLVSQSKKEEAKKLLPRLFKILDKAAKEKSVKRNNASRRKSRVSRLVQKPTQP
jgi:small subunit ribosomal protein S20